jgi:predicted NBD/HSP70 family sugar kinase
MPSKKTAPIGGHGSADLPLVTVESYNLEIKDSEGFIGDSASKGAFLELIDDIREKLRAVGEDPLGKTPTEELGRRKLDKLLDDEDKEAAAVVHGAAEEFAGRLARVIRRFSSLKSWRDVERIVIGGGFRQSRVGELAIGRTSVLLKEEGFGVQIWPIRNHPDEAGLIGCAQLAPTWMFKGHDSIVAVDIGGSNIRCGVVELRLKRGNDLSGARVWKSELWRHADDDPKRDDAVEQLTEMIERLVRSAKKNKLKLAPFIGIGCPGVIAGDGSIERGAQNLPGNWESSTFNLAECIRAAVPEIGDHETVALIHNDAVVQGLSEAPFMHDVQKWAALTIGTGLGNASFVNKERRRKTKQ